MIANLDGFKECFKDVDELVVLPVYAAGEEPNGVDLKSEFKGALFAESIKRNGDSIEFFDNFGVKHSLTSGLVIGFGAGDISYQLRGER